MESSPPPTVAAVPSPADASGRGRPDPEFAPEPYPRPRLPPGAVTAEHQRLVVNPFLAVAGLAGLIGLTTVIATRSALPPLAVLPPLAMIGLPMLVRFHCVDCGTTGPFRLWPFHACPKVVARALRSRSGWLLWPGARLQLVVWLYILGCLAVLAAVLGFGAFLLSGW